MKLASFSAGGRERLGIVLDNGRLADLQDVLRFAQDDSDRRFPPAPADMIALIEQGDWFLDAVAAAKTAADARPGGVATFAPEEVAWQPCVRRPTKICCLALNNSSLDEVKISAPKHPAFFIKPSTALVGHRNDIVMRSYYGITHPEPELAVIIGRVTKDVSPTKAAAAIFGYSIHNDITSIGMRNEDSFHFRWGKPKEGGGFDLIDGHTSYAGRYKGSDTFSALGPYLVTKDEIRDPHDLRVTCSLAGELAMDDSTKNLTHSVYETISFISRFQTLMPGDVISMGTALHPAGEAAKPLSTFDLNKLGGPVTVSIDGLGTLENPVRRN
jgi:2-keto-4-pentenoate hydratase/2-oxohepta-3-ene-1,7-dioic acid hydratase in catechol pathway